MNTNLMVAMAVTVIAIVGCVPGPKSEKGFRLPDGDAKKGKATFVALKCHACHRVEGVELPAFDSKAPAVVKLGGEVSHIKTYGELVTSIINPSHQLAKDYSGELVSRDGKSLMTNFNDTMTVTQMIDLVAFLQTHYQVVQPESDHGRF